MSDSALASLLRGIERFNRQEYFEAHEVWETLWLAERGPLADFYKGLIQCAAALLQLRRGRLAGARRLYERQRSLLVPYAPETLGIAVGALLADMDALFARVTAEPPGPASSARETQMPRIAPPPDRD